MGDKLSEHSYSETERDGSQSFATFREFLPLEYPLLCVMLQAARGKLKICFLLGNHKNMASFCNLDLEMWNVRDRTMEGMPRTNNKLEGWHSGIQSMFQGPHPNIWKFVRCLGQEQILQHGELIQLQAGQFREKKHKQY